MPASEKQRAANRANAARSTGPRTAEGKERSKLNAVTHGLTAQASVLPGEDRADLEALSDSLMRQLKPSGVVQRIMAERIVSLAWKLRRVARAEESVARDMLRRGGEDRDGVDYRHREGAAMLAESLRPYAEKYLFEKYDSRLRHITEYELKLDGALRAAVRELLRLQKDKNAFEDVGETEQKHETHAPAPPTSTPRAEEDEGTESSGAPDRTAEKVSESSEEAPGENHSGENDPGLRCAAPPACGDAPSDKTNPIAGTDQSPQVGEGPDVTPDLPTNSSAPAPGTFSSPPPAPRR